MPFHNRSWYDQTVYITRSVLLASILWLWHAMTHRCQYTPLTGCRETWRRWELDADQDVISARCYGATICYHNFVFLAEKNIDTHTHWKTLTYMDIRWHTSTYMAAAGGRQPLAATPPCAGCSSELGPWLTGESGIWNLDNFEQYPGRTGLDLNVFITSLAARAYDFHVFIHGCDVLIVLLVQCPYSYGVVTLSIMLWYVRICLSDSVCVMKTLPGIRVRACCSYHISWTSREVSFTWVACHSHAAETMFWHAKVTSLWHSLWISFNIPLELVKWW